MVEFFFKVFLIISFFSHNFQTCSLAYDWSQTINLCKIVILINFLRIDFKIFKQMKTKSTYLQSYKQIEAPGTLHKHLTVYQSQSDIFHPSFEKTAQSCILFKKPKYSPLLHYTCANSAHDILVIHLTN